MGLFSRKTKANAADFSREFYDRYIFGRDPTGGDFASTWAETSRRLIAEADSSFNAVGLPRLTEEFRALQLEMIGTAWTHTSKPEVALAVSEVTKLYLSDIYRSDLWDAMTEYNQAVAESATFRADPKRGTGRAKITFVNVSRANLFEKFVATGRDPEAVARVANRFGSEASCKAGVAQGLLAIRVTQRLGIEGSDHIWERLAAVAFGYYRGAKEALDGVQLTA